MIRSMASARARSIVIVMSVRSVDYEMPEMRAACSNAAQSKVTRRHSIALAAGAGGGVSTQHGRPPLSVAVAAAASFSFPSLLLRASFTVSGLKTSSPSPPPSFRFRNGFTGASTEGREEEGKEEGSAHQAGKADAGRDRVCERLRAQDDEEEGCGGDRARPYLIFLPACPGHDDDHHRAGNSYERTNEWTDG